MVEVIVEPYATESDPNAGGHRVTIDGMDLTRVIANQGMTVEFDEMGCARVKLTLLPANVRLRLPQAEVTAAVGTYLLAPSEVKAMAYDEAARRAADLTRETFNAPSAEGL